jgi:adenylate kinase family enzyme
VALIKYEIAKHPKQAIFIDGFPRAMDQVGYSMYLKEIIGYRDDPDFLVFISLPNPVIHERIKYRVVCPICKVPRNLKLLATKHAGYDEATGQFYLMCDKPECKGARMVPKEGDEQGIEPIRERLETDDRYHG